MKDRSYTNIQGDKNTETHCGSSACQLSADIICELSVFQRAARRMMSTYRRGKRERLCILTTAGKFLCPLLTLRITSGPLECIFSGLSLRDHERVQRRVRRRGPDLCRKPRPFRSPLRMYIEASDASGNTGSGNSRDSPYEQDDDIALLFFSTVPTLICLLPTKHDPLRHTLLVHHFSLCER